MNLDNVEALPLIARGGQADIYDYGDGKIIRVPRRPQDYDRIRYEYRVYRLLTGSKVRAPRVYDLVEVNGAPSIIMERIPGISMMDQIRKQPFLFRKKAIDLAHMHLGLRNINADASMTSAKDQAKYCIGKSGSLTESTRQVLLSALERMPGGNSLCHGDFHPGNILHNDGGDYIIDWSGATQGDFAYDVAHTYILLRVVPRVPGVGVLLYFVQRALGKAMARVYLKTIMDAVSISADVLPKWVMIKAAERTYYGLPSEMKRLHAFVSMCAGAVSAGKATERLYKRL